MAAVADKLKKQRRDESDHEACNPSQSNSGSDKRKIIPAYSDTDEWESRDEEELQQTYGEMAGQFCAWCLINHTDIPLFFISFLILYLSINRCCYCVVIVAIISALLCMRFPLMNATLWSALIVLYLHKDWNLNFGNVKISWNRST
jgi:hypothetical protein